ncbi:penicillin acylase family protein [Falsiroseomonas sp. E2-1-a20]|uniref:penicillin acylase family protein n=1 Tax=Falsiroseomonas sp. E2-1-a20 TaxID=3239300 RepID=UPI003F34AFB8
MITPRILRALALSTGLLALLPACAALAPAPASVEQRLAALPRSGLDLARPVTIRWNEHMVPWIEAETDADLAHALGLVHGHLRAGQILILRNIARGRLSEMLGPLATEYDHALRILDFGRAAPEIERRWPPETRAFVARFLAGLNHAIRHGPLPPEAGLLALRREPLTVADMLAIGRLAGSDVNWFPLIGLLQDRGQPGYAARWQRLREGGTGNAMPDGLAGRQAALGALLQDVSRSGSNTVAVAAARSASGGAMIANDPHLGLVLPNVWLLAGMRSPSFHMVGMMVPGLPVVGFGRSPDLAWGGTNMRAASSDVFDITHLPAAEITTRETLIARRFWTTARRSLRDTPHGPVMSDAALLRARPGDSLALRWAGHEPTDEITALLRAARARNGAEFRESLVGFGVSPLNLVYAERAGGIGRVAATVLPSRRGFPEADPVLDARDPDATGPWQRLWGVRDLPQLVDPADGVITSANENPETWAPGGPPMGYSFSDDDRLMRLRTLLQARPLLRVQDLVALQADTRAPKAALLAAALLQRLDALPGGAPEPAMLARMWGWDGDYAATSEAALVFELLLGQIAPQVAEARGLPLATEWGAITTFLLRDLDALPAGEREALLRRAVERAAPVAARHRNWGEVHRMRAGYVLSFLPVVGEPFIQARHPVGGSRETPMKSGHGFITGPHDVVFGSMARHISDMSDPDANWFSLWGGQDGWLGSAAFLSQIPIWQRNEGIRLPLRPEVVAAEFPLVTRMVPQ